MLLTLLFSALCVFVSICGATVLWALASMSNIQVLQQDDTVAYLRLTTDFQKGEPK